MEKKKKSCPITVPTQNIEETGGLNQKKKKFLDLKSVRTRAGTLGFKYNKFSLKSDPFGITVSLRVAPPRTLDGLKVYVDILNCNIDYSNAMHSSKPPQPLKSHIGFIQ